MCYILMEHQCVYILLEHQQVISYGAAGCLHVNGALLRL